MIESRSHKIADVYLRDSSVSELVELDDFVGFDRGGSCEGALQQSIFSQEGLRFYASLSNWQLRLTWLDVGHRSLVELLENLLPDSC